VITSVKFQTTDQIFCIFQIIEVLKCGWRERQRLGESDYLGWSPFQSNYRLYYTMLSYVITSKDGDNVQITITWCIHDSE